MKGGDGHVLWVNAIESEVKGSYERDKIPDSRQYCIKDYPHYDPAFLPELLMSPSKVEPSTYPTEAPPGPDESLVPYII